MNITGLSTNGLRLLHDTIRGALREDDALPKNSKKFGVREYRDWREQSDEIDAELTKRSEPILPIAW